MGLEEGHHKQRTKLDKFIASFIAYVFIVCLVAGFAALIVYVIKASSVKKPVPNIELASMDFTVFNITDTHLSAKWDLSIRIPGRIPGFYICLQGDFQASFLYKNVTLATSSPQKYYDLKYNEPQLLRVSASVSGEIIDGLIGKDIMKDMKENKEVRFGSRFYLTDCRKKTTGTMSYSCDQVILRFKSGSDMKAALFGKNPSCINF